MSNNNLVKRILTYDNLWCNSLQIYNPYRDPWPIKISKNVPDFDGQAFRKYRKFQWVYDKLLIATSQGLNGGTLENLITNEPKHINYPIFIKPRYGHKSASSKNCFKIKCYNDLLQYKNIPEMIWTEFIPETEGMTDYLIHNGNIVHQITYLYSETQHGTIADDWKKISPSNKPPDKINNWTMQNMRNYSGVCNVQYRGDKIIEIGLRFARGGAYIYSTNNLKLIKAINDLVDHNRWDYNSNSETYSFKEFYSFKCYTETPILYLYPQYVLDNIMYHNECKEFYEYYFEPAGKGLSMVCFQFLHNDFETGMKVKNQIENMMSLIQLLFVCAFIISFIIMTYNKKVGLILLVVLVLLYSTRLLNPISTQYSLWKSQKQALLLD